MDLSLNETDRSLQERARAFCDQILLPLELEVEEHGGLPEAHWAPVRDQVVAWGLAGINHSVENGGCGFSIFQQILINEQLGRATSGLWDVVFLPPVSLKFGTDAQKRDYLVPSCRGARRGCFAISEPGAGSDPRQVRTKAMKAGRDYVLSGEKWFVTTFGAADYVIVHAHVDDDPDRPTLFLVDKDSPGLHHQRSPHFMHTFIYDHAEIRFDEVRVPESKRLGEEGQGFELTKDWFVEARLQIGARCLGAATRALELATDYAAEREQFGQPIIQFQGVSFPIADMAVEIMAAKSMLYRIANFAAAFNSGDGAGVAALYTADAALLPPGGARVDGRNAIQAFWQGAIDGGVNSLTLQTIEVESHGNLAYEVSTFSFQAPGEGGGSVTVSGKYIVVWKRTGSHTWQLHRDIWNMDPAP